MNSCDKAEESPVLECATQANKEKPDVIKEDKDGKDVSSKGRKQLETNLRQLPDDGARLEFLVGRVGILRSEGSALKVTLAEERRRTASLQRERDQLKADQARALVARTRMESLCRELQRQNRAVREEAAQRARVEDERRKEVTAKFQGTLHDLTALMQENGERNGRLRDENAAMANRISFMCDQFERREEEVSRLGKQLDLERQLAEAQVQKAQLELQAEREMWAGERDQLQLRLQSVEVSRQQQQSNMDSLQANVKVYTDKYEEFQSTLTKSNQVFESYKTELATMQRQNAVLEKELKTYKLRWKKSDQVTTDLMAAKLIQEKQYSTVEKKFEQLQKLCRQLQADRSAYLKILHLNNIEPPVVALEPAPIQSVKAESQTNEFIHSTAKEEELVRLKQSLRILEDQFAGLSAKAANETGEENPSADQKIEDVPIILAEEENDLNGEVVKVQVNDEAIEVNNA